MVAARRSAPGGGSGGPSGVRGGCSVVLGARGGPPGAGAVDIARLGGLWRVTRPWHPGLRPYLRSYVGYWEATPTRTGAAGADGTGDPADQPRGTLSHVLSTWMSRVATAGASGRWWWGWRTGPRSVRIPAARKRSGSSSRHWAPTGCSAYRWAS